MEDEVVTEINHEDEKKTAPLAAMVNAVLEKREEQLLERIGNDITKLGAPDRSVAEAISDDGPVTTGRGNDSIMSRHQPTDGLYRNLLRTEPQYRTCRDPDQDHWNVEWLRALKDGDVAMQKMAYVKSDEAHKRACQRANELYEGTLDTTSPTALTLGIASGLLPQSYTNVIEIAKQASAVIAPLCTNFTTTGNTLRVPAVSKVTAVMASEAASVAQATMAISSVMMILTKMGARIYLSDEMIDDAAFNVMQIAGSRVGQGIGEQEDIQILTSNGASPNITGALAGGDVTETTTQEFYSGDLAVLFFALGKAYQNNATWLAGTVLATQLTLLTDTNGRQLLQAPNMPHGPVTDVVTPAAIGTIYGRPVYHVPATAGTLIFGDLRSYGIVRKGGIVAKVSGDMGFATDTVQFKFTQRWDGQMLDAVGIKQFADIATYN